MAAGQEARLQPQVFKPDDPFFEEGDLYCALHVKEVDTSAVDGGGALDCSSLTPELLGMSEHICEECTRVYPSGRLLELHILESHDTLFKLMAANQNMYECAVEGCKEKFRSAEERKDHLVSVHRYPSDYRFIKLQSAPPLKPSATPLHPSAPPLNPSTPPPLLSCTQSTAENAAMGETLMEVSSKEKGGVQAHPEETVATVSVACLKKSKSKFPVSISFGRGRGMFAHTQSRPGTHPGAGSGKTRRRGGRGSDMVRPEGGKGGQRTPSSHRGQSVTDEMEGVS